MTQNQQFKQLREELIQLKLDQFEQKQFLLSEETDNVENSVELETRESVSIPVKQEPTEDGSILLSYLTYATDLLKVEKKEV